MQPSRASCVDVGLHDQTTVFLCICSLFVLSLSLNSFLSNTFIFDIVSENLFQICIYASVLTAKKKKTQLFPALKSLSSILKFRVQNSLSQGTTSQPLSFDRNPSYYTYQWERLGSSAQEYQTVEMLSRIQFSPYQFPPSRLKTI